MDGMYAESSAKRVKNGRTITYKLLMLTALVYLGLIIGKFIGYYVAALVFFIGLYLILAFAFKLLDIEYEYVFCDGQIDFDCIKGGKWRKHILRIELENADLFAPWDDEEVKKAKIDTTCNFYSLKRNAEPYALIVKKNDKLIKVLMEPNIKFIKCVKTKMPRKTRLFECDVNELNNQNV